MFVTIHFAPKELSNIVAAVIYKHFIPTGFCRLSQVLLNKQEVRPLLRSDRRDYAEKD